MCDKNVVLFAFWPLYMLLAVHVGRCACWSLCMIVAVHDGRCACWSLYIQVATHGFQNSHSTTVVNAACVLPSKKVAVSLISPKMCERPVPEMTPRPAPPPPERPPPPPPPPPRRVGLRRPFFRRRHRGLLCRGRVARPCARGRSGALGRTAAPRGMLQPNKF